MELPNGQGAVKLALPSPHQMHTRASATARTSANGGGEEGRRVAEVWKAALGARPKDGVLLGFCRIPRVHGQGVWVRWRAHAAELRGAKGWEGSNPHTSANVLTSPPLPRRS
jgi:hypothetical protein